MGIKAKVAPSVALTKPPLRPILVQMLKCDCIVVIWVEMTPVLLKWIGATVIGAIAKYVVG